MGSAVTMRILVVAEDHLGATLARDLCDRVVIDRGPDWVSSTWGDAAVRETQRRWSGFDPAAAYTSWVGVKKLSEQRGLPMHPLGMKGYAAVAYRAAHMAALQTPRPDALVMCMDTQGVSTHRADVLAGLARAHVDDLPMLLAVAHQEVEAWVLAGFLPRHNDERDALVGLTREIGLDPTAEPHRMTPGRSTALRDAKRCLTRLLPDGTQSPRAVSCWLDTPLEALLRRAASTGMPEYVADVERALLPAITGAPARPGAM